MTIFRSAAPPFIEPRDDITIPQFILDNLAKHPSRPRGASDMLALVDEESGRLLNLGEIRSRTNNLSRAMGAKWGIGKDSIIAICSPNHVDYPISIWAAHRLGAAVAMTSPTLTASELAYQFKIVLPMFVIAYTDNLSSVLEAASMISLPHSHIIVIGEDVNRAGPCQTVNDVVSEGATLPPVEEFQLGSKEARTRIALLCFSSGTTGKPKAVAVSHYNLICNIIQIATFNCISSPNLPLEQKRFLPGDKCIALLPFCHIYGFVANLHYSLFAGMGVVVMRKYNHENLLRAIERHRITHLYLVPPQIVMFCKHPSTKKYNLSSIRLCMVGAAPLTAELMGQMLAILPNIFLGQGYGLTETTAAVTLFPPEQRVGTLGSAGRLLAGTIAKVLKEDGALAGVGERGELCVKGGQIALGYYMNDEATKASFIDGWFHTGDEVVFHENGDMFITDRIKELIKVKGNQVAPAELEGHLLAHPHVADAGVIGIPHGYDGEQPFAYIVLQPDIVESLRKDPSLINMVRDGILQHVTKAKSRYKWLTGGVAFVAAIPKSASGKILRRVLREQAKRQIVRDGTHSRL